MRCLMCGQETEILTNNSVCENCEKYYYSQTPAISDVIAKQSDDANHTKQQPGILPTSRIGWISVALITLLTILFIFGCWLTPILFVSSLIGSIFTILCARKAQKKNHDRAFMVKTAYFIGIIITIISTFALFISAVAYELSHWSWWIAP